MYRSAHCSIVYALEKLETNCVFINRDSVKYICYVQTRFIKKYDADLYSLN